ncbi:helix-turn-helix domain-containing protein [Prosthecobacter sp.]|uniref:helix-turn-helix domain-containing protein n=1 Tax=Prosthecobacter sp. TaxID=1965333 RepID=UPI001D98219E|nr:helix-turn-helix domain-containing protein [Prosthecobacter sp.]MCB1276576.1 helix-turn-helix domain-containing protein [Prosthecobacter sp.]
MPKTIIADAWRSLRHEWLWVYRGPVPTCGVWSAEIPVPPGVFFVERGEVRIRADENEIVVPRGHAFFSAPGLRKHWFAEKTQLLSVGFRSTWPDGTPLLRTGLNVAIQSARLRRATLELFRAVHCGKTSVTYREATQPAALAVVDWARREAAFGRWFADFLETLREFSIQPEPPAGKSRRRVDQLIAWLNARPLDQATPTLPPAFPLGMRRAEQLLQQHLGVGLRAFLERRRLEAARERIVADNGSLKELAYTLGFRHASHFTAWFRRHTGVSPSAYRAGGAEAV